MRAWISLALLLVLGAAAFLALRHGGGGAGEVGSAHDEESPIAGAPPAIPGDDSGVPAEAGGHAERHEQAAGRPVDFTIVFNGAPAAGAEVYLLPLDAELEAWLDDPAGFPARHLDRASHRVLDAAASFRADLPDLPVILAARVAGSAPTAAVIQADLDEVEFELLEECVLTGTVTFEDGLPAAGVRIVGRKNVYLDRILRGWVDDPARLPGFFFSSETISNADGTYQLRGLRRGMNLVEASLAGYTRETAPEVQVPWWPEHHFVLRSAATLSGRVTAKDTGEPIEQALVEVVTRRSTDAIVHRAGMTAQDGTFALDGVPGDLPWLGVRASKRGYAAEAARIERLPTGAAREVDFSLRQAVPLSGVALDAIGRPVNFVSVLAFDAAGGLPILEMLTGEDGRFATELLGADTLYRLVARRRGATGSQVQVQIDDLSLPCDPIEIVLPAHGVLAGRVEHESQPVLQGGWVRLGLLLESGDEYEERWAEIGKTDGVFRFEDVPPGPHSLCASAEGYAPARLSPARVDPPRTDDQPFTIAVEPGVALRGRVVDAATGEAIRGATIRFGDVSQWGYVMGRLPKEVVSGSDGSFQLEHVARGARCALLVEHPDFAQKVEPVLLSSESGSARHDVALVRGASIRAWIADAGGRPLADADGWVFGKDRTHVGPVRRTGGVLLFDRLEPGPTQVRLWSHGASNAFSPVDFASTVQLESGRQCDVLFATAGTGVVAGRVQVEDGASAARLFQISVRGAASARENFIATFACGNSPYHVFGAPEGECTVAVRSVDAGLRLAARRTVEVWAGETSAVDFAFGAGAFGGTVRDVAGKPLAGAAITALGRLPSGTESTHTAESLAEGEFEMPGLFPGRYDFYVLRDGFGREEGSFEIDARGVALPEPRVELRLEPEARILVSVRARSGALGVPPEVGCAPLSSSLAESRLPDQGIDSAGRHVFSAAKTGRYLVTVVAASCFPEEREVSVTSGADSQVDVEVRRLADLEIRVDDANGLPLAGSAVGVVDAVTGRDASEWLARGLIEAIPAAGVTDASGRLLLRGLPEGRYTLEVPGTVRSVLLAPGSAATKAALTHL